MMGSTEWLTPPRLGARGAGAVRCGSDRRARSLDGHESVGNADARPGQVAGGALGPGEPRSRSFDGSGGSAAGAATSDPDGCADATSSGALEGAPSVAERTTWQMAWSWCGTQSARPSDSTCTGVPKRSTSSTPSVVANASETDEYSVTSRSTPRRRASQPRDPVTRTSLPLDEVDESA